MRLGAWSDSNFAERTFGIKAKLTVPTDTEVKNFAERTFGIKVSDKIEKSLITIFPSAMIL